MTRSQLTRLTACQFLIKSSVTSTVTQPSLPDPLHRRTPPRLSSIGGIAKISFMSSFSNDTIIGMMDIMAILKALCENPNNVRFADLAKLCDAYFGEPRQKGTSHRVY